MEFTSFEYLCIDIANQAGHDKLTFLERIQWVKENFKNLEEIDTPEKERPLYEAAVIALRKAQKGLPTGHLVGLDASCSGIQIMSALTGCYEGAKATNLVNTGKREDAYSQVTKMINDQLGEDKVEVARSDAKKALMTSFYGSKATPKAIFGEESPELEAFYKASAQMCPGAWELLQILLQSWKPYALSHEWKLPDGYDVVVKVMTKKQARIEVKELGTSFTYEYYENEGEKFGLSNAANLVHSVDAYVLRTMHRRCNYNLEVVSKAKDILTDAYRFPKLTGEVEEDAYSTKVYYYLQQYLRSGIADVVILPWINSENVHLLPQQLKKELLEIINGMLQYKPFPLVTVHDEFKAHPNNLNWVRYQYREILAQLANSNLLDDLLSQLYGKPVKMDKLSSNLSDYIRQSEYALC